MPVCKYPGCRYSTVNGRVLEEHEKRTHWRCSCGDYVGAFPGAHIGQTRRRQSVSCDPERLKVVRLIRGRLPV